MSVRELERLPNGAIDGDLCKYDTRERCSRCHQKNPIGFTVPDEVWQAIHDRAVKDAKGWMDDAGTPLPVGPFDILCIVCFTSVADWHGIEWDEEIEFYPVSRFAATAPKSLRGIGS